MRHLETTLMIVLLLGPTVSMAEMYKWVDKDGVTRYGDRIPPEYAKQEREVLNKQGQTVKILEQEKTAAELAEEARQAELKKQAAEQARRDRVLLDLYGSEADLHRARDEQLANLDGNIRITEMALENTRKDLDVRKKREAELTSQKKPIPPDLERQIKELSARVENDEKALASRQAQRAAIAARFERDIIKWRELRGVTAPADAGSAPDQGANTSVGK
jgi:hypothetical protein